MTVTPDDLAWLKGQFDCCVQADRDRVAHILAYIRTTQSPTAPPRVEAGEPMPKVTEDDLQLARMNDKLLEQGFDTYADNYRRILALCEWRLAQDTTTTDGK